MAILEIISFCETKPPVWLQILIALAVVLSNIEYMKQYLMGEDDNDDEFQI